MDMQPSARAKSQCRPSTDSPIDAAAAQAVGASASARGKTGWPKGAEALHDGHALIELVAAGEAANQRKSPVSVWTTWASELWLPAYS